MASARRSGRGETQAQQLRRYKHALRKVSDLADGVPMWVAGAIISYVLDEGMTFEQAKAAYDAEMEAAEASVELTSYGVPRRTPPPVETTSEEGDDGR